MLHIAAREAVTARGWLLQQWSSHRDEIVARVASSGVGVSLGADRALTFLFDDYLGLGRVSSARAEAEKLLQKRSSDDLVLFAVAVHAALIEALKPELCEQPASIAVDVGTVLSGALQASVTMFREVGQSIAARNERARQRDLEARILELEASHCEIVREERMKAMSELAGGVAHDLNNALNAVLLRTALARRGAPLERALAGIESDVHDAAAVVDRLEVFARANVREDAPLNVNDVVREAVSEARERLSPQAAVLWMDLDEVSPVIGDRAELQAMVVNVLANASDAILARGGMQPGRIEVRTRARPEGTLIEVSDDGTGIPQVVLERIFEPFFTTRGPSHSGLGLAVAYGCARRIGGSIHAENRDSGGATIRITLPAAEKRPCEAPSPDTGRPCCTRNVLIAAPPGEERDSLAELLGAGGHRVEVVDPHDAVTAWAARARDAVLCFDLDVAHAVRGRDPTAPIALVNADAGTLARDPRASVVDAVFARPVDCASLCSFLGACR